MLVDVRDTDYVWSVGKVTMIIEQINKDALYVIHFEGKPSAEDEIIYRSSDRLAKHGTYTSRPELPQWHARKNQDGEKEIILRNQILSVAHLFAAQKSQDEPAGEAEASADKDLTAKSPPIEILPGMIEVPQTLGHEEQQLDQIEQQINAFLNSFEESHIDAARVQRWANQQNQQNRPIYLRNVIDSFQQAQTSSRSGPSLIESLTRHLRGGQANPGAVYGDGHAAHHHQHHHGHHHRHVGRHSHSGERGGSSGHRENIFQSRAASSSTISSLLKNIYRIEQLTTLAEAAASQGAPSG